MKMQKLVAAIAVVSMMAGSFPVEARVGSSSFSSSRSTSPSAATRTYTPAPSYQSKSYSSATSPSRLGGGGSVGMTRSDVTAQARQQSQGTTVKNYGNVGAAPAPTYRSPSYTAPAPTYQAPARQGYSGAHVAGAAIAGAAVGALAANAMHNNNNAPVIVNNNPGYVPQGGGVVVGNGQGGVVVDNGQGGVVVGSPVVAGGTVAMAPAVVHSSGFGFGSFLLMLLLLGVVAFVLYRVFGSSSNSSFSAPVSRVNEDDEEEHDLAQARGLLSQAESMFRQLQDVNNRGDKAALERMTTEDVFASFAQDIDNRSAPSQTRVISVNVVGNQVMGFTRESNRYVGSIHFRALVNEGEGRANDDVDEVWHFVKDLNGGQWKLAGIEQV